jgi:hypothetical protein
MRGVTGCHVAGGLVCGRNIEGGVTVNYLKKRGTPL